VEYALLYRSSTIPRTLAIAATVVWLAAVPVAAGTSQPRADASKPKESKPAADALGTQKLPAVVALSTVPVLRVESTDKTPRVINYRAPEWVLAYCTAALAFITAALALYTYRLYRATVRLGADAKVSAEQQSTRMERSIVEANRAATAMEAVAMATTNNAMLMQTLLTKQMRAYVSVDLGVALYQDAKLRFGAGPQVINNGLTPARNVSFKVVAEIIDVAEVTDITNANITFAPIGNVVVNDMGLAPRQSFRMNTAVEHRVLEAEVEEVMKGETKRLFAWGKVTYDDVYGGSWETNFCFNYTFYKNAKGEVVVNGFYFPRHNSAT
jgi:hypothetical protein